VLLFYSVWAIHKLYLYIYERDVVVIDLWRRKWTWPVAYICN